MGKHKEQFEIFKTKFNELVKNAPPEFFEKWYDKYMEYTEYPVGWTIIFKVGVIESLPNDLKEKYEELIRLFRAQQL